MVAPPWPPAIYIHPPLGKLVLYTTVKTRGLYKRFISPPVKKLECHENTYVLIQILPPNSATVSPQFNLQHDVLANAWEKAVLIAGLPWQHRTLSVLNQLSGRGLPVPTGYAAWARGTGHRKGHKLPGTRYGLEGTEHKAQGTRAGEEEWGGGGEKTDQWVGWVANSAVCLLHRQQPGRATEDSEGSQARPHHRTTTDSIVQPG